MNTILEKSVDASEEICLKIETMKKILDGFEKIDYNTLSVNDKIKLNNTMAYCYTTLCFALTKLNDNTQEATAVKKELVRIQNAFRKAKRD